LLKILGAGGSLATRFSAREEKYLLKISETCFGSKITLFFSFRQILADEEIFEGRPRDFMVFHNFFGSLMFSASSSFMNDSFFLFIV